MEWQDWYIIGFNFVLIALLVSGVLLIWLKMKNMRRDIPINDERGQRMVNKAATFAFYVGSYFLIVLLLLIIIGIEFFDLPEIQALFVIMAEIFVLDGSFLVYYAYISKKGIF
jgi:uncharacterized iron-regulated membrane protein